MSYDDRRRSIRRAEAIACHLQPGSTVLDFGAHRGAIAAVLAAAGHPVTAVAPGLRDLPGVDCIGRKMTPGEVRRLPMFDHVLALAVLHHQDDWRDMYDALTSRCSVSMFVETPAHGEPVPGTPDLIDHFAGYPMVVEAPGYTDGFVRRVVKVAQ